MVLLGRSAVGEDFVAVVAGSDAFDAARVMSRRSRGDGHACDVSFDACHLCYLDASSYPSWCPC